MVVVSKYTLYISDPEVALAYRKTFNKKIFITGIILSLIRIIRMLFAILIDDPRENYILFIPEYENIRWISVAIQCMTLIFQKIYPERMNVVAIPTWIAISMSTIDIANKSDSYPTYSFLFK